jgi:hypothetical protein
LISEVKLLDIKHVGYVSEVCRSNEWYTSRPHDAMKTRFLYPSTVAAKTAKTTAAEK